jgi:hypothetical protein
VRKVVAPVDPEAEPDTRDLVADHVREDFHELDRLVWVEAAEDDVVWAPEDVGVRVRAISVRHVAGDDAEI